MEAVMIERSIVVKADRERVWQAITTPEHIAKWFEPIRFERLAVGESLTFGWGGEGSIALVEPMDRFGFRWQIAPPHPAQTLVVFALETVPEGCDPASVVDPTCAEQPQNGDSAGVRISDQQARDHEASRSAGPCRTGADADERTRETVCVPSGSTPGCQRVD